MTGLLPEHRQYLLDHAITDEVIDASGTYSTGSEICFPWRDGDTVTMQRRPWPGRDGEYYWETGESLHFWVHREPTPDSPVLLVEGTKQSLAALSWAPPEYAVYGMVGCEGAARIKLKRFKGRRVVVVNDADAATNLNVYSAAVTLSERLEYYTKDVKFTRLPARGTTGLDDVLSREFDPDERTDFLVHLITGAKDKPADKKPDKKGSGKREDDGPPNTGGRVSVIVNGDRLEVVERIAGTLAQNIGGTELFSYGGLVTRVSGHSTQPLTKDALYATLIHHVACFNRVDGIGPVQYKAAWPDPPATGAVLEQASRFPVLERVTRTPFVRADGSVCSAPGYDAATRTYLSPGELDGMQVDESPSQELVQRCAQYLMGEWLGDFPFETDADRANMLGLLLTPFIRGNVPLMPMAILNGLHMGVGKNKIADLMAYMTTGEEASPLALPDTEDEMRKQITSVFQSGGDTFVFDEGHTLESKQLARALTSRTYTDRILGVSRQGKFPNKVVWMDLGNQVQVNGDMARRVFHVKLKPTGPGSYNRTGDSFRHPDIDGWTLANRQTLVRAALTVIRGWYAAGAPAYSRGWTMGSFEQWDRLMSGVLAYAGYPQFLTSERERRSESDFQTSYWHQHMLWLESTFRLDTPFTTAEVRQKGSDSSERYEGPPDLTDVLDKNYTRRLGQAYARKRDVPMHDGIMLVQAGTGHNNTRKWQVVRMKV